MLVKIPDPQRCLQFSVGTSGFPISNPYFPFYPHRPLTKRTSNYIVECIAAVALPTTVPIVNDIAL
jgi:hypothetical protein